MWCPIVIIIIIIIIIIDKKQKVKQQAQGIELRHWEEKELLGRYPKRMWEADVDDSITTSGSEEWDRGTDNCCLGPEPPSLPSLIMEGL